MPHTGPPEQALAGRALPPPAAIDTAAIPASTARHERLVRRLRMLAPPGLACTGTPREMLAQLSGGDSALKRQCRPSRHADAAHRRRKVCRGLFGAVDVVLATPTHAEAVVRLTRPRHFADRPSGRHVHLQAPLCSSVAFPTSDKHWLA